jgi:hypothetical protein
MQNYYEMKKELKDHVWNLGYHHLAREIGNRFRSENLLILTDDKKDVEGALRLKDNLYDFATAVWVYPIHKDTSLEEIEPHLKGINRILLFKEIGYRSTMKPLIDFGRLIRRKFKVKCDPVAFVDLEGVTRYSFASREDGEMPEVYVEPFQKIYEFTRDYNDPLIIVSVGEESKSWAECVSGYMVKRFMRKESYLYPTTLIFEDDEIKDFEIEKLEGKRVIAAEDEYNKIHRDRIKRFGENGHNINGLMYFCRYPEPHVEIFWKKS